MSSDGSGNDGVGELVGQIQKNPLMAFMASTRPAAVVRRRLKTKAGKRFGRFIFVAAAAVIASQLMLTFCLGVLRLTAGKSAVAAWLTGAIVSYVLSRWAWERKGRPQLFKETLPFLFVSLIAATVLTLSAKFANQQALAMGFNHQQQVLFVDVAYLIANCVTFVMRFIILHFILFADTRARRTGENGLGF